MSDHQMYERGRRATQTYDIITAGGALAGAALAKVMAARTVPEARILLSDTGKKG